MRFLVFCGILFPFLMTALGAAVVFLFRGGVSGRAQRICLGFAAGVMAAAAAFSLLMPAIEQAASQGDVPWLVAALGFLLGAGMIVALDVCMQRQQSARAAGSDARRRALLVAAVTLHNIPEGLAVGLAFAQGGAGAAAAAVALGIGLQNLPEGAAISLPMRQSGMSRRRSFGCGVLSGVVEPAAAALVLLISAQIEPIMPGLMAFAAGAMMAVVFGELSPAADAREGMLASVIGFAAMMALDVGLG